LLTSSTPKPVIMPPACKWLGPCVTVEPLTTFALQLRMRLMAENNTEGRSAWDWGEQRVTVGRHFIRDMEGLWSEVLKLAAVVEESLNQSIRALCDGRVELADQIKHQKPAVDRWEVQIERECVRVLALHQPVASDLRRVAVVLKINGDLERMADLARHIAKRVKKLDL